LKRNFIKKERIIKFNKERNMKDIYLSFEGRINRKIYWLYYLLPWTVVYVFLSIVTSGITVNIPMGGMSIPYPILPTVFAILAIWPALAISVKRCHDRGRSGFFILIGLIPLVNIWMGIELLFLSGTSGSNKFGDDPLST
jgi:uncharacterized membrane protein YhaH (DUF805 family)